MSDSKINFIIIQCVKAIYLFLIVFLREEVEYLWMSQNQRRLHICWAAPKLRTYIPEDGYVGQEQNKKGKENIYWWRKNVFISQRLLLAGAFQETHDNLESVVSAVCWGGNPATNL